MNTTITKTVNDRWRDWSYYTAAMQAVQIHLPQDSSQRLTFSGSRVNGVSGIGAGYAYKFDRDDNLAITAGIGSAGGHEVGVVSVGFEFGGDRSPKFEDDDSVLERRIADLERNFARQKALWQEEAQRCADDLNNAQESARRAGDAFRECLAK